MARKSSKNHKSEVAETETSTAALDQQAEQAQPRETEVSKAETAEQPIAEDDGQLEPSVTEQLQEGEAPPESGSKDEPLESKEASKVYDSEEEARRAGHANPKYRLFHGHKTGTMTFQFAWARDYFQAANILYKHAGYQLAICSEPRAKVALSKESLSKLSDEELDDLESQLAALKAGRSKS